MECEETLVRLVRLLGCLPGVQVAWASNEPHQTSIGLLIDSQDSLALLVRAGADANTPSLKVKLRGSEAGPGNLRYVLEVEESSGKGHRLTPLQVLGIFLARDLKAHGLIPAEESDELQRSWDAKVL